MKKQICNFVIGAAAAAALWTPLVQGQVTKEVATIPFAFHVNQSALPAGEYTVLELSTKGAIQLRNNETRQSILVVPPGRESDDNAQPRLTFHRCGDQYFLSQIWMPGQPGYSLKPSKLEQEMAALQGSRGIVAYVPMGRR